jgi:hypothetical protein
MTNLTTAEPNTEANFSQSQLVEIERQAAEFVRIGYDPQEARDMATKAAISAARMRASMAKGNAKNGDEASQPKREPKLTPEPHKPATDNTRNETRKQLVDHCPAYYINERVANFRGINATERCCLGLLNALMKKHGYAYVTDEQLAYWLDMKPEGLRPIMRRLRQTGCVDETSRRRGVHRWVVRDHLRDKTRKASGKANDDDISF